MAHLDPLEKEFLIRQFRLNSQVKLRDFCALHKVSDAAFRKWLKQYEEGGLEGLARADSEIKEVLPEGVDRTEESYKREILRLRIENERLKKNYAVQMNEAGEQEYIRLREKRDFQEVMGKYVKFYNEQRPCFAIGYDTPSNYRKRYNKGEIKCKETFEKRELTSEPKFVQKKRAIALSDNNLEKLSTFENGNELNM